MTRFGKVIDLAKVNPLGRLIPSVISAAASAFGVALIAVPCYAVAAPASGASTLASASSTLAKQRSGTGPHRRAHAGVQPREGDRQRSPSREGRMSQAVAIRRADWPPDRCGHPFRIRRFLCR